MPRRRQRRRLVLAGIVLALGAVAAAFALRDLFDADSSGPSHAASASGTLVWQADFESGDLSQWEGVQQFDDERAAAVESPHREGRYAGRFEAREGEFTFDADRDDPPRNRTEAVLSDARDRHRPREGSDWWYRWWFYLPAGTSLPADGSPGFVIMTQHVLPTEPSVDLVGTFEFRDVAQAGDPGPGVVELTYGGATRGTPDPMARVGGGPYWAKRASTVSRDAWHQILLHKKWSSRPSVGFVELWFDGERQKFRDGSRRVYHANLRPGYSAYMKQGVYRTNSLGGSTVIYMDGLRIGTTRASVEPGG
jgi:hypothetical protein